MRGSVGIESGIVVRKGECHSLDTRADLSQFVW